MSSLILVYVPPKRAQLPHFIDEKSWGSKRRNNSFKVSTLATDWQHCLTPIFVAKVRMSHAYCSAYDMTSFAMNTEWLRKEVAKVSRQSASSVLSLVKVLVWPWESVRICPPSTFIISQDRPTLNCKKWLVLYSQINIIHRKYRRH